MQHEQTNTAGDTRYGERLTAVLPLKTRPLARGRVSDLARVEDLLLPSFKRYWSDAAELEFLIVVPHGERRAVERRLHPGPFDLRVISEDSICPTIRGSRGWFKQQIVKLAAARAVTTPCYLTLDADLVLTRPLSIAQLFPQGKPVVQRTAAADHWHWWIGSSAILRSPVAFARESIMMDVTPAILHRALCLELLDTIANRNDAASAERFLFEHRRLRWTEYSLYWLYLLEKNCVDALYDARDIRLYDGIWFPADVHRLTPEYVRRAFEDPEGAFFLIVQSNLKLSLRFVRKLLGPYLGTSRTQRPWRERIVAAATALWERRGLG